MHDYTNNNKYKAIAQHFEVFWNFQFFLVLHEFTYNLFDFSCAPGAKTALAYFQD